MRGRRKAELQSLLPVCPGCDRHKTIHTRGICRTCYKNPEVRTKHAKPRVFAPSLLLPFNVRPKPPAWPTRHPPGSEGKMAVMAARLAAGEELFHPDDFHPYYPKEGVTYGD